MCDVWLLALWVWSIDCWLGALERKRWWLYLLSSVLAAAAALTKYFGLSLVPLLFVYTLVNDRRFKFRRLCFFSFPLSSSCGMKRSRKRKYGIGLFSNAVLYPWTQHSRPGSDFSAIAYRAIIYWRWSVSCLFFALLFNRRTLLFGAAIFVLFLPIFYFAFATGFDSKSTILAVTTEGDYLRPPVSESWRSR